LRFEPVAISLTKDREQEANIAKKLHPKETIDLEELLMSGAIQSETLINLLERKGIISKREAIEKTGGVAAEMPKART